MATPLYWDPLNGNDANDGTSYANRKKTLSALTTISTGGVIRGIASPVYQLSSNATWTNSSATITLGASVTQMITDCETAWTASANVTSTASTTTPREGTKVAQHVIAAAFTTGLASYYATGTLDLSGYQQVSFWFKTSVACASGDFSLKLCTDTAGVTAAHTITIQAVAAVNNWVEVTVDTGGAMNSAIKSVALYQNVDIGAVTVSLDNILACKASSSADALTLHSLIGKNTAGEPQWWNIRSINGTTVILDPGTTQTTNQNYYGTTETVATYRMEPYDYAILAVGSTTGLELLPASGTASAPILISGGWTAASSMASQSGYTGLCARGGGGVGIGLNSKVNVNFENLVFSRVFDGLRIGNSNSVSNTVTNCQAVACSDVGFYASANNFPGFSVIDSYTQACLWGVFTAQVTGTVVRGIYTGCATGAIGGSHGKIVAAGAVVANSLTALYASGSQSIEFYNGTIANCTNLTLNSGPWAGPAIVDNSVISSVTNMLPTAGSLFGNELHIRNYNATTGDYRIYTESSTTIFDTSTYPTGGQGGSWKLSPTTTNRTAYYPIIVPIKPGPLLRANQPVTINGQYKRDNANITASVVVKGGYLNGISTDQTATLSAAAGTWATFSITVTPTVTGFPRIELQCYDGTGTTNSAWFYLLPPG